MAVLWPGGEDSADDEFPLQAGSVLLAARLDYATVDRIKLARLGPCSRRDVRRLSLPARRLVWAIAWGGAAVAVMISPKAAYTVRFDAVDLLPVLKIGTFLAAAAAVLATTGLLEAVAAGLQDISDPRLLLLAMMVSVELALGPGLFRDLLAHESVTPDTDPSRRLEPRRIA